jgi:recombination protein RecR
MKKDPEYLKKMAQAILELKNNISVCGECFSIANTNPCPICSDPKRDKTVISIVADYRDMIAIEALGQYNGSYHILGGALSAINGINPEQLNLHTLVNRIKKNNAQEIILALNQNLEGETTALYLTKFLKQPGMPELKITRLAKGLPTGADLEYADEITLSNAIKYRNEV